MIRIYLDWNVFKNLKSPVSEVDIQFKKLIDDNRSALLIPYSLYHILDLSHNNASPQNIKQFAGPDLNFIDQISDKSFLGEENDEIVPKIGSAISFTEYIRNRPSRLEIDFENLFDGVVGKNELFQEGTPFKDILKNIPAPLPISEKDKSSFFVNSLFPNHKERYSAWELLKDFSNFIEKLMSDRQFIKDYKNEIRKAGFDLDGNQGNWKPDEVIGHINELLSKHSGEKLTVQGIFDLTFKDRKKAVTRKEYFINYFLTLELYGYQTDKLPKKSNTFENTTNDASHAFLGAFCDYFVTNDERLLKKARVLYHELNIETKATRVEEILTEANTVIHKTPFNIENTFSLIGSFLVKENLIESHHSENGIQPAVVKAYKLPVFFFNYFNYLIDMYNTETGVRELQFRRVFKNYSRFIFYLETKQLLQDIFSFMGPCDKGQKYPDYESEFTYAMPKVPITWSFNAVCVALEKEDETHRESLSIYTKINIEPA